MMSSALLDAATAQIGKLHDGPDVPRMAREIGEKFPRMEAYCANAKNDTAWCGIFIAWLLAQQGIEPPFNPADDLGSFMWVDSWANTKWAGTWELEPQPGDIIVRRTPHHVNILKEIRGGHQICVGGNQTGPSGVPDSVTEASYSSAGVMAIVRPPPPAQISTEPDKSAAFVPLDQRTIDAITTAAASSDLVHYSWGGRGPAPLGYIKGMAATFGQALHKLAARDSAAVAMIRVVDGAGDVFDHYEDILKSKDVVTDGAADVDRLRALWVILTGLGMRESSGGIDIGRDRSASNTTADTAEAGTWQQSWDSRVASPELPKLLTEYLATNPDTVDAIFKYGITLLPGSLENSGEGDGLAFQALVKRRPSIAAMFAAIALRTLYTHWGPIVRREVEITHEADALFRHVQEIVGTAPVVPEIPQRPKPMPEVNSVQPGPQPAPPVPQLPAVPGQQDIWLKIASLIFANGDQSKSLITKVLALHNATHPDLAVALPAQPVPAPAPSGSILDRPSVQLGGIAGVGTALMWLAGADPNLTILAGIVSIATAALGPSGTVIGQIVMGLARAIWNQSQAQPQQK
jgi:hypothetical protein